MAENKKEVLICFLSLMEGFSIKLFYFNADLSAILMRCKT